MYTHSLGAFTLLALNLLALILPSGRRHLLHLVLANLAAVVLYSPWLVSAIPTQLTFVGQSYWIDPPGADAVFRALMLPVFTFYEPPPIWLLGLELFTAMLLLVFLILQLQRQGTRARWFLLLGVAPIIGMMAISLWKPVYLERALLPAALFYLIALGWLLTKANVPDIVTRGLTVLLLVTTAASLWSHYTYVGFPRPPFPKAVAYLEDREMPGDAVIHPDKSTFLPVHYYAPDLSDAYLADPPGSAHDTLSPSVQEALGITATSTITKAVGAADRVWLVYFPHEMEAMRSLTPGCSAYCWIERRFVEVGRETFGGLVVAAYERTNR
jgi:hypothetical protein